ncbi:hypothetical protein JCGZ_14634 [Jatropha curcas]|uniref:non-specific serine/threonine protein kinase n=1 Tax=Jatropha curcas TaxID=180498 RepID=A0A067K1F1_JATCU|nr:hypothetical protein JCGZ_14634 [Jatropha curcas]
MEKVYIYIYIYIYISCLFYNLKINFGNPWKKDPAKKKELSWGKRLLIMTGAAEGLEYLHSQCQIRIIHRDIKASNVLLDLKFKPKISDFGLARFYSCDRSLFKTTIAGTLFGSGGCPPIVEIRINSMDTIDQF